MGNTNKPTEVTSESTTVVSTIEGKEIYNKKDIYNLKGCANEINKIAEYKSSENIKTLEVGINGVVKLDPRKTIPENSRDTMLKE